MAAGCVDAGQGRGPITRNGANRGSVATCARGHGWRRRRGTFGRGKRNPGNGAMFGSDTRRPVSGAAGAGPGRDRLPLKR
jgi:hypothetical protein